MVHVHKLISKPTNKVTANDFDCQLIVLSCFSGENEWMWTKQEMQGHYVHWHTDQHFMDHTTNQLFKKMTDRLIDNESNG